MSAPARRTSRAIAGLAVAMAAIVGLSACDSTGGSADKGTASAQTAGFPVSIKDVYGTTTVPARPERVAVVGWGSADAAIALGTIPVAMPKSLWGDPDGDGVLAWTTEALKAADAETPALHDETDSVPYEKISDSAPDVILATNSGLSEQEDKTLAKIAPTVAYPGMPWGTGWRQSTAMVGDALGKADAAKELIAKTEERMKAEMAKYPATAGKTGMVFWVDAKDTGKLHVYTPKDTRVQYLNDLGFATPDSVIQLTKGAETFVTDISAEEADRLDADIAVVYIDGGDAAVLTNDPLLSKIPAIANGAYLRIDSDEQLMAISAPTVLSIPWALPAYAKQLGDAAAKVK
ncbi:ABC transporter substrate-binding protein [Rhizomonospora bruguierae]|uniref:ABC transporter substrate-binding protein n=1 Tax=Rhizomonospora bruguierae TaxID=1581705 RepID=UPI001BCF8D98|nr:ABC transporter substrate-binding protein [Micromonospora sp. NBRC 107566]